VKSCAYCGRENGDDASHCRECGTEFPSAGASEELLETPAVSAEHPVRRSLSPEETQQALATVCTCRTLEEADLLVTQLNAAGINATIPDEALSRPWRGT
jgi:hypothetical protein